MEVRRKVSAQMLSLSLEHSSQLRGQPRKALQQLNSATVIFLTHSPNERCLVVKAMSLGLVPQNLPCREGRCTLNLSRLQRPPDAVVGKLREEGKFRCRSLFSFDH
ncbi:hypothetical protein TNCV_2505081 [Trichonephila clavipes]|uniref:Uncharacterized protein n=1 Tax=Trichonephila clavipes TaxID=2585209 RepID=A0A8X6WG64_TRICX|nr:hypothetical protein TNCV_2505081 [Trichonephila clavipes]